MSLTDLIGTAEAARILDRSHRTVHRLVQTGRLVPAHIVPGGRAGVFIFRRADVERLARQVSQGRGVA